MASVKCLLPSNDRRLLGDLVCPREESGRSLFSKISTKNTLTVSFTAVHGNYYQSKHSLASIILRAVHSRLSACVRLMILAIFLLNICTSSKAYI